MTTNADVQQSAALCEMVLRLREERNCEFKRSEPWDVLKNKIAKTAIGMANTLDGGVIVVGVSQAGDDTFSLDGIDPDHLQSYREDDVRDYVNLYADPNIEVRLVRFVCDGKTLLAIEVPEADELPIVCEKDGNGMFIGDLYVRSRGKVETRKPRSAYETRELLELAANKRTRRFMGQLSQLGLLPPTLSEDTDQASFDQQLEGLT